MSREWLIVSYDPTNPDEPARAVLHRPGAEEEPRYVEVVLKYTPEHDTWWVITDVVHEEPYTTSDKKEAINAFVEIVEGFWASFMLGE